MSWTPCWRLIPSRYPTVGLFDAIADPADLAVVFAIEALGNPRLRDELGELELVPPDERVSGPGSTVIMAAFTHLNPEGSRFSDGSYGVYYAAKDVKTALAEVIHHREIFLSRTREPEIDVDMRVITAELRGKFHDLRGLQAPYAAVYARDHYGASQELGRHLREQGSLGVIYDSVRKAGGTCAAIFRPRALTNAQSRQHLALHWDGVRVSHWYEKSAPQATGEP